MEKMIEKKNDTFDEDFLIKLLMNERTMDHISSIINISILF